MNFLAQTRCHPGLGPGGGQGAGIYPTMGDFARVAVAGLIRWLASMAWSISMAKGFDRYPSARTLKACRGADSWSKPVMMNTFSSGREARTFSISSYPQAPGSRTSTRSPSRCLSRASICRACSALSAAQTRYSPRRDSRMAHRTSLSSSTTRRPLRSAGRNPFLDFTGGSLSFGVDLELPPRPGRGSQMIDVLVPHWGIGEEQDFGRLGRGEFPVHPGRFFFPNFGSAFGGR